jgi:hypothetical protein
VIPCSCEYVGSLKAKSKLENQQRQGRESEETKGESENKTETIFARGWITFANSRMMYAPRPHDRKSRLIPNPFGLKGIRNPSCMVSYRQMNNRVMQEPTKERNSRMGEISGETPYWLGQWMS